MRKMLIIMIVLGITLLGQVCCTQERDISIGEVEIPSWEWGERIARLEVINNSSLTKFIIAETDVQFTGEYLNPNRKAQTFYVLASGESALLEPKLIVPGNYGKAQIWVRLYDVVDTMDLILPDQLAYEQPFSITYRLADGMVPYSQDRILMPPRIENHPDFDNEFARVLLWLLDDGKTMSEIAEMAGCDVPFVMHNVQMCVRRGYVWMDSTGYHVKCPLITADEAQQVSRLANGIGDSLANIIAGQMDAYQGVLDSLVSARSIPTDTNTFMDGGTILYYKYPVVSGLALWWDLGEKFISPGQGLRVFTGDNLCNTFSSKFIYAAQGNLAMRGTSFYAEAAKSRKIFFGDRLPEINCGDNILGSKASKRFRWQHAQEFVPESFIADSVVIRPAVNALTRPADQLLVTASDGLKVISSSYGHDNLTLGYKYWFWNLTASRALNTLVENGTIERRGNGQFRFDGISRPVGK